MTMKMAVFPDGQSRAYTMEGEIAIVEMRGYQIEGRITEENGATRFRQLANHHGAHLMWYPPRAA